MRSLLLLSGAAVLAGGLSGPAMSQGTRQTVGIMKVDPQTVATGYRTSKVVGASVVNEANETVGSIDDLIVTTDREGPLCGPVRRRLSGHGHEIRSRALQRASDEGQEACPSGGHEGRTQGPSPNFKYSR